MTDATPEDAEAESAKQITREQARTLIGDGAQLVDVRVGHEWDAGHIPGALHLPLEELPQRLGELDRERAVILYCRGGSRSTMATEALLEGGFDATKLREGIVGWSEAGLALEPAAGYVAESGEAAAVLQARRRAAGA